MNKKNIGYTRKLYAGAEIWETTNGQVAWLEGNTMKSLRWMCGVTKTDIRSKVNILEDDTFRCGMRERTM